MISLNIADIDWTNAVIIPVGLSLTIGVALSIWTGLIAGRYVEFKQALRDALDIFMNPDHLFLQGPERIVATNNILRLRARIGRTFNDQGQYYAHKEFEALCENLEKAHAEFITALNQTDGSRAVRAEIAGSLFEIAEPILLAVKNVKVDLAALILGKTINTYLIHGRYHYDNFTEHLETGKPLAEIQQHRNQQKQ